MTTDDDFAWARAMAWSDSAYRRQRALRRTGFVVVALGFIGASLGIAASQAESRGLEITVAALAAALLLAAAGLDLANKAEHKEAAIAAARRAAEFLRAEVYLFQMRSPPYHDERRAERLQQKVEDVEWDARMFAVSPPVSEGRGQRPELTSI